MRDTEALTNEALLRGDSVRVVEVLGRLGSKRLSIRSVRADDDKQALLDEGKIVIYDTFDIQPFYVCASSMSVDSLKAYETYVIID